MEGSISGLDSTLTCSVMAPGVPSHLMTVNWIGGSSLAESPRVNVSDLSNNMSLYTRTVTFSPLLNDDAGQYNCSVSVTGYDEATTSDSVMVDVNGMAKVITKIKCKALSIESIPFGCVSNLLVLCCSTKHNTFSCSRNDCGQCRTSIHWTILYSLSYGKHCITIIPVYMDEEWIAYSTRQQNHGLYYL